MLRFEIVGIGRRPMLIQCRTDLLISHSRILLLLLLIVHLEPSIWQEAKCFSGIGVYDSSSRVVSSITPESTPSGQSFRVSSVDEISRSDDNTAIPQHRFTGLGFSDGRLFQPLEGSGF